MLPFPLDFLFMVYYGPMNFIDSGSLLKLFFDALNVTTLATGAYLYFSQEKITSIHLVTALDLEPLVPFSISLGPNEREITY